MNTLDKIYAAISTLDRASAAVVVVALMLIGAAGYTAVTGDEASRSDVQDDATHIVNKRYAPLWTSSDVLYGVISAMDNTPGGAREKARTRVEETDRLIDLGKAIRIENGQRVKTLEQTSGDDPRSTVIDVKYNGQDYVSLMTYFRPL